MAAPTTNISWGDIVGGYGRIGIYTNVTSTNTEVTVNIQTWFWSKYSVSDAGNSYYFNNLSSSGSATTKIGSINLQTTHNSGTGWSTSNQVKLGESTVKYSRGTSNVTRYLYAKLTDVDRVGGTMYASRTVSIPKLPAYTVSYNVNGGSGKIDSQTKWYGKNLTISKTTPTRTGYSFQGWALTKADADDGDWYYQPGGTCGKNENLTLYAVWKANTYKITFNSNGGTGGKTSATKTYGVTLKLPSASADLPTRTNYNFLGWSTSATASTPTYTAGGNYTSNSAATLYAVWELAYVKPRIKNFTVERCKSDETLDDEGTYALVKFDWECDANASSVRIQLFKGTTSIGSESITVSGISGSVSKIIGGGDLSTENTYTVKVIVADANGQNEAYETVYSLKFLIDALAENKGIAFGKTAEFEDMADFNYTIYPRAGFINVPIPEYTDFDDLTTPNTYISYDKVASTYTNCPITSGTFTLDVAQAGNEGQIRQIVTYTSKENPVIWLRYYYGSEWGDWMCLLTTTGEKVLWGGDMTSGMYMTAGHTANLLAPVSKQQHGIVLVFSYYNSADDTNFNWQSFFVPKYLVSASTSGHTFTLTRANFAAVGTKYLYIRDTQITGHDDNNKTGTANGITYANNKFVLRYVLGV